MQRRMEGDQTIRLSRAEKVELVHRWVRTGRSLNQCQEVTGLTKLERYIRLSDHDQTRTA